MKKIHNKILSVLLALLIAVTIAVPAFAASAYNFANDNAYASIVTGSDFQQSGGKAYTRYYNVLSKMKEDGLGTPDSVLCGGDYSKFLPDSPAPGLKLIRDKSLELYPEMNDNNIVLIQGNHDIMSSGFAKTGWYDMGAYLLYAINENDFPWKQNTRADAKRLITKLANDVESKLNGLIESGDIRPVIILTHVPLHYSARSSGGDNKYSSILFNVLNEAGKKLDIIFLFGHNHSGSYDNYIGGTVNFLAPGSEILIPDASKPTQNAYVTETLNFTYTNCGYIGYGNADPNPPSSNALTLGVIRIKEDSISFVRYSEDGMYNSESVTRINQGIPDMAVQNNGVKINNAKLWDIIKKILDMIPLFTKMFHLLSV